MPAKLSDDWKALHGIFFFALLTATTFVPFFRTWPLIWVAPLSFYFLLVALLPPFRATFSGWSFGRMNQQTTFAAIGIAIVSSAALACFQAWSKPDLHAYASMLPKRLPGGLLIAGIIFSIFNALLEELIFRGVLFTAIESQTGATMAVAITAALFGYGHMHGYPPGLLGAALAGGYGLALGWLRVFSGGLGLPVIAHIAADATIFMIVVKSGAL